MNILVNFDKVYKTFYSLTTETNVLKDISFKIYENEIVALLGPSGCGKSTILNMISSLEQPSKGKININGKLGYMFQKDALLPWRNVLSNINLGLEIRKNKTKENLAYSSLLIKKYKLEDSKYKYPNELSGGMRQRVALIRTLVLNPDILLLDEPFSALDAQTKVMVQNDVYNVIKQEKKTAIIVTHDIGEALALADRIIILSSKPSTIKKVIDNKTNYLDPLKRRKIELFNHYYNEISHELGII